MLSLKVGKNVCTLGTRILVVAFFFLRSRQTRCDVVASTRSWLCDWYCGSSGDNDWMIRTCVLPSSICRVFGAVSAAIMVGRSVFVCSPSSICRVI